MQVTNQMVTACKNYITNNGHNRIWDQSYEDLIVKLLASTRLYKEYQKCFHKTKKKIEEMPGARPFDFSEMYIFGKFDAFCKRIDKVCHLATPKPHCYLILFITYTKVGGYFVNMMGMMSMIWESLMTCSE